MTVDELDTFTPFRNAADVKTEKNA